MRAVRFEWSPGRLKSAYLNNRTAFAGVATRRDTIILTIKSDRDLASERIFKREQTSAKRWHVEVRLSSAKDVDAELKAWLRAAYAMSA